MFDTSFKGHQSRNAEAGSGESARQAVRRELWLDLEDTLVTPITQGWHLFDIINLTKIKNVISDFKPQHVSIFSFAIWDQHQLGLFNRHCRPHLEQALEVKFDEVLTVDEDIKLACCREMGISAQMVDFIELSNFWGKQGAFRHCMRHRAKLFRQSNPNEALHTLLLDDVVEPELLVWPDLDTTVDQWNIDRITLK